MKRDYLTGAPLKRYYFTRTDSEIIEAETESLAWQKLALYYDQPNNFRLESVEDA